MPLWGVKIKHFLLENHVRLFLLFCAILQASHKKYNYLFKNDNPVTCGFDLSIYFIILKRKSGSSFAIFCFT